MGSVCISATVFLHHAGRLDIITLNISGKLWSLLFAELEQGITRSEAEFRLYRHSRIQFCVSDLPHLKMENIVFSKDNKRLNASELRGRNESNFFSNISVSIKLAALVLCIPKVDC